MDKARTILALLAVFSCYPPVLVSGDYELSIRVHSYSNPSHRRENGDCCDFHIGILFGQCGECDNYFRFCLRPVNFLLSDTSCPLGERETGEVAGDSHTFGNTIGDRQNPITFSVRGSWTGTFQLRIDVVDGDSDYQLITDEADFVDEIFAQPSSFSSTTGSLQYTGRAGRSTITLSFSVRCAENYYGTECSTYCEPSENYICNDQISGKRICTEGYYNPPECSTFCRPRNDAQGHYTCNNDGSIQCLPNYYGTNCTVFCSPVEGRYTCNNVTGEIECLSGYGDASSNCTMSTMTATEEESTHTINSPRPDMETSDTFRFAEITTVQVAIVNGSNSAGESKLKVALIISGGVTGSVLSFVILLMMVVWIYILRVRKNQRDTSQINVELNEAYGNDVFSAQFISEDMCTAYGWVNSMPPGINPIDIKKNDAYGITSTHANAEEGKLNQKKDTAYSVYNQSGSTSTQDSPVYSYVRQ